MIKDFQIICFLGPDGSGKSTLAKFLLNEYQKRDAEIIYFWWLEGENTFLRQLIRKTGNIFNKKPNFVQDNSSKKKVTFLKKIYMNLVFYDYCRFGIMKILYFKYISRKKILILDRFMYDIILFLTGEFQVSDIENEKILKWYSRLLPKPDLIFIMNVDPQISFSRKPDEIPSIKEATRVWEQYQKLYSILPKLTPGKLIKIDNSQELSLVKKEILQNIEFI